MQAFATVEQARSWFFAEIEREDLDFVDNVRFAFADDAKEADEYEAARNDGCCGFVDMEVKVDGRVYWMGCNYGH